MDPKCGTLEELQSAIQEERRYLNQLLAEAVTQLNAETRAELDTLRAEFKLKQT